MQPSLSLIAASISAAIALSPLGAKPAQAASASELDLYGQTSGNGDILLSRFDVESSVVELALALRSPNSAYATQYEGAIAQRSDDEPELEASIVDDQASNQPENTEINPRSSNSDTLETSDISPSEPSPEPESASIEADALIPDRREEDLAQENTSEEEENDLVDESVKPVEDDLTPLEDDLPPVEDDLLPIEDVVIPGASERELDNILETGEIESPNLPDLTEPVDPEVFGLDGDPSPVSVPEYLNSPANPLFIPTEPEEVELSGTQPITLEQAIEIARRNSTDLQEALLQLEQSKAALRQEQARYLPNLNLDLTLNHQGTNTFQQGQEQDITTGEFVIFTESIYNEATTLNGNVNLTYDIYTSGQRSSLVRAAEERVRLQELQVEVVAEQLRLDVTQDYYDLQQTDELVRIAAQSLEESLQSLRDAQALERAGVGTRFDSLQAEVEVANSRQDLIQALSDQEVARRQLSQRINSYQSIDLSAADPIEVAGAWELSLEDSIILAYQNRAELEQQLVQRDISEQQRRANLATLGPQLSAFARYNLTDLLDETESPSDSETYAIGLQATLQLYDGGAARAAARQEEINIALAENNFEETERIIRFQVEQAYSSLQANFENIQTATVAVETATEALRLARLRFQAGVGTQTDVLQAQTDLTRAEVNRLQAVLGYNRSLAQLQRSVSNLPDSELADRP